MVADTALTYYGVEWGLVEAEPNRAVRDRTDRLRRTGAFKLFALGVGLAERAILPAEYTAIVPLGLAVPWKIVSLINVALIVTVS